MATQPVKNTIHKGAHEMVREADMHDPHHDATSGQNDSQARTDIGGARGDEVNKAISGGHFGEGDRKFLMDMPDDKWQKIQKWAMKGATEVIQPYTYEGIGDRSNVGGPGSTAAHNRAAVPTAEEYARNAPPEIREVLMNGIHEMNAKKDQLISVIVNNKGNVFHPQWLASLPLKQLEGIAALAGAQQQQPHPRVANYGGQGDIPMFLEQLPTNNQDAPAQDDEPLQLPVWNFEKPKQTA